MKQHWERYKLIASVGSLEEPVLVKNFVRYLKRNRIEYRMPYPAETLDDYADYLFRVMEEHTPEGRYFGTPNDEAVDVFGYWMLPDERRI
jgi:hypothetical protein